MNCAGAAVLACLAALAVASTVVQGQFATLQPIEPDPARFSASRDVTIAVRVVDGDFDPGTAEVLLDRASLGDVEVTEDVIRARVMGVSDGTHAAEVRVRGSDGRPLTATWVFPVDASPPFVLSVTPANGTMLSAGALVVAVEVRDPGSGLDPAGARITLDGEPLPISFLGGLASWRGNVTLGAGPHSLRADFGDRAGNTVRHDWGFTVGSGAFSPAMFITALAARVPGGAPTIAAAGAVFLLAILSVARRSRRSKMASERRGPKEAGPASRRVQIGRPRMFPRAVAPPPPRPPPPVQPPARVPDSGDRVRHTTGKGVRILPPELNAQDWEREALATLADARRAAEEGDPRRGVLLMEALLARDDGAIRRWAPKAAENVRREVVRLHLVSGEAALAGSPEPPSRPARREARAEFQAAAAKAGAWGFQDLRSSAEAFLDRLETAPSAAPAAPGAPGAAGGPSVTDVRVCLLCQGEVPPGGYRCACGEWYHPAHRAEVPACAACDRPWA